MHDGRGHSQREYREPVAITQFDTNDLALLARLARKGVFEICQTAEHGHIGGSSAAAELFVTLYFGGVLRFNPSDPSDPCRDRVLVRGHLGPLRYRLFAWLGWLAETELSGYRRLGSRLHGHEDHLDTPGVDITPSGSLGMLLSYGVGCALAARDMNQEFRTWVFLGDGEEQEGIVSEAARHAAHLNLSNLIVTIDRNRKQLSNPTNECDSSDLAKMWAGYGWNVEEVPDGHNVPSILKAFSAATRSSRHSKKPTVIIAETLKGIGLEGARDHYSGYHTISRVSSAIVRAGIEAIECSIAMDDANRVLQKVAMLTAEKIPSVQPPIWRPLALNVKTTTTTANNPDACQREYFQSLQQSSILSDFKEGGTYFLTADVTTREAVRELGVSELFTFHNVGVREQHMIAMAHGISLTRPSTRILINALDAFTYRCMDQISAALQGKSSFVMIGDVSGLTNARNGRTHQTTGLTAGLLAMDGLTFLEPWDAEDTFLSLNWALGTSRGLVYIRVNSSPVRFNCKPLARR